MRQKLYRVLIAMVLISGVASVGFLYVSGDFSDHEDTQDDTVGEDVETPTDTSSLNDGTEGDSNWDQKTGWSGDYSFHYKDKLAEETGGPTDKRYINPYSFANMNPPTWVPENEHEIEDAEVLSYEITRYPNEYPTQEQLDEAWQLYKESFEAAEENDWFDYKEAREDGYRFRTLNNHYHNVDDESIYDTWGEMDPETPPTMIFYEDPEEKGNMILVGFMFHQPVGTDHEGEQVGGPLTEWHYHPLETAPYAEHIKNTVSKVEELEDERDFFDMMGEEYDSIEEYEGDNQRTAEMIHVWFIEHREGPFATSMEVASQYIEEPDKMEEDEFKNYTMKTFHNNLRDGKKLNR